MIRREHPDCSTTKFAGAASCLAVVVCLAASACGIRTEPRPPEMTMPNRPSSLTAMIENDEVRLRWIRPKESVDGQTLRDLAGFVIERRSDDTEFGIIAEVPVNDRERIRPQTTFKWRDLEPVAGRSFYRVRAVTEDGQTGLMTPAVPIVVDAEIVAHAAVLRDAAADAARDKAAEPTTPAE